MAFQSTPALHQLYNTTKRFLPVDHTLSSDSQTDTKFQPLSVSILSNYAYAPALYSTALSELQLEGHLFQSIHITLSGGEIIADKCNERLVDMAMQMTTQSLTWEYAHFGMLNASDKVIPIYGSNMVSELRFLRCSNLGQHYLNLLKFQMLTSLDFTGSDFFFDSPRVAKSVSGAHPRFPHAVHATTLPPRMNDASAVADAEDADDSDFDDSAMEESEASDSDENAEVSDDELGAIVPDLPEGKFEEEEGEEEATETMPRSYDTQMVMVDQLNKSFSPMRLFRLKTLVFTDVRNMNSRLMKELISHAPNLQTLAAEQCSFARNEQFFRGHDEFVPNCTSTLRYVNCVGCTPLANSVLNWSTNSRLGLKQLQVLVMNISWESMELGVNEVRAMVSNLPELKILLLMVEAIPRGPNSDWKKLVDSVDRPFSITFIQTDDGHLQTGCLSSKISQANKGRAATNNDSKTVLCIPNKEFEESKGDIVRILNDLDTPLRYEPSVISAKPSESLSEYSEYCKMEMSRVLELSDIATEEDELSEDEAPSAKRAKSNRLEPLTRKTAPIIPKSYKHKIPAPKKQIARKSPALKKIPSRKPRKSRTMVGKSKCATNINLSSENATKSLADLNSYEFTIAADDYEPILPIKKQDFSKLSSFEDVLNSTSPFKKCLTSENSIRNLFTISVGCSPEEYNSKNPDYSTFGNKKPEVIVGADNTAICNSASFLETSSITQRHLVEVVEGRQLFLDDRKLSCMHWDYVGQKPNEKFKLRKETFENASDLMNIWLQSADEEQKNAMQRRICERVLKYFDWLVLIMSPPAENHRPNRPFEKILIKRGAMSGNSGGGAISTNFHHANKQYSGKFIGAVIEAGDPVIAARYLAFPSFVAETKEKENLGHGKAVCIRFIFHYLEVWTTLFVYNSQVQEWLKTNEEVEIVLTQLNNLFLGSGLSLPEEKGEYSSLYDDLQTFADEFTEGFPVLSGADSIMRNVFCYAPIALYWLPLWKERVCEAHVDFFQKDDQEDDEDDQE